MITIAVERSWRAAGTDRRAARGSASRLAAPMARMITPSRVASVAEASSSSAVTGPPSWIPAAQSGSSSWGRTNSAVPLDGPPNRMRKNNRVATTKKARPRWKPNRALGRRILTTTVTAAPVSSSTGHWAVRLATAAAASPHNHQAQGCTVWSSGVGTVMMGSGPATRGNNRPISDPPARSHRDPYFCRGPGGGDAATTPPPPARPGPPLRRSNPKVSRWAGRPVP